MNALDEALLLQKSQHTHYDEPALRKIIDGLVQLIERERADHGPYNPGRQ